MHAKPTPILRRARRWAGALLLTGFVLPAAAADAIAGKAKASRCITCHGSLGMATMPGAPNLAGQVEMYLQAQLKAFRNGRRSHQIMNVIARDLSEEDIADLSAWFASIEVRVQAP